MTAYAIVATDITDEDEFAKYIELAGAAVKKYGAEFLVRTAEKTVKEGESRYRTTVVKFPDMDTAESFYNSVEYQAALKHAKLGAVRDYKLVPGA